jgi:hypothetical protein
VRHKLAEFSLRHLESSLSPDRQRFVTVRSSFLGIRAAACGAKPAVGCCELISLLEDGVQGLNRQDLLAIRNFRVRFFSIRLLYRVLPIPETTKRGLECRRLGAQIARSPCGKPEFVGARAPDFAFLREGRQRVVIECGRTGVNASP